MSTTLTVPMGLPFSENGFEIVIKRDGRIVSRTIAVATKAKVKKSAIADVKSYLDIHHGRGDWTAEVYESRNTESVDPNTFITTWEWVRASDTPFFTF